MKEQLIELTAEQAKNCKVLGRGFGPSLGFCVFLATKHVPNFWERVAGYRRIQNDSTAGSLSRATGEGCGAVEFYEGNNKLV